MVLLRLDGLTAYPTCALPTVIVVKPSIRSVAATVASYVPG